jgi:hypothetical protein
MTGIRKQRPSSLRALLRPDRRIAEPAPPPSTSTAHGSPEVKSPVQRSRIKRIAFGIFLMPLTFVIGGALGLALWQVLVAIHFVASLLLQLDVNYGEVLAGQIQDSFMYGGGAIGIVVGWLIVWTDE